MHVASISVVLMYKKDTGSRRLSVSDSGATVGESEEATCARGSSLLGPDSTPQGQSGKRSTASHIWEMSFCLTPPVSFNNDIIVAVDDETCRVKDHPSPNERMTERLAHAKEQAGARA